MTAGRRVLLDKYLPVFEARERHEVLVHAPSARAYAAVRALDLERSLLVRALFRIRTLPGRIRSRQRVAPRQTRPFLETALSIGWQILEEAPGEEIVVGAVTQPWTASPRFDGMPGETFCAFAEPGYAKIAWNFAVHPAAPGRARVSTETRIVTTDPASRRLFRRYWLVFGPFIRLIRVVALRRLRRELARERPGV